MKYVMIVILLIISIGCNKLAVEKPERLIDKEVMVDIMYDLALLNVVKYQYAETAEKYEKIDLKYVYKKYKIDSAQFVQSNSYYAADYKGYKVMYDEIALKIENNKTLFDSLHKLEEKKIKALKKRKVVSPKKPVVKKDSVISSTNKDLKINKTSGDKTQGVLN